MEDILPKISIKCDVAPREFAERICYIAEECGHPTEYRDSFTGKQGDNLWNIYCPTVTNPAGAFVQIIESRQCSDRVKIELRARRWNSDRPDYKAYIQTALSMIGPLLKEYNRRYHTARRLAIQKKEDTEPHLSAIAGRRFDLFCSLANKSVLHPLDWDRFYQFCHAAHRHRARLSGPSILRLLVQAGFSEDYAEDIAKAYDHCRGVLKSWYEP